MESKELTFKEKLDKHYPTAPKEYREMLIEAFKENKAGFNEDDSLWYTNDIILKGIQMMDEQLNNK
jgi:hypothetical protein